MSTEDGNRRDAEELVRWLAEVEEEGAEESIDERAEERLAVYRRSQTAADPEKDSEVPEDSGIEAMLGASPVARARLAALSGVSLPEPSRSTRETVLAGFAASLGSAPQESPRPHRSRWPISWLAAAAALAAVVLGTWWLGGRFGAPAVPEYQATIAGLAEERAAPVGGAFARAYPETIVRIEAMPRAVAAAGIELGLYRSSDRRLERITEDSLRRLPAGRGAAVFEARAADLVGSAPGRHVLYLVAARSGRLPDSVEWTPGAAPGAALPGRQAIALEIEMLAAP